MEGTHTHFSDFAGVKSLGRHPLGLDEALLFLNT